MRRRTTVPLKHPVTSVHIVCLPSHTALRSLVRLCPIPALAPDLAKKNKRTQDEPARGARKPDWPVPTQLASHSPPPLSVLNENRQVCQVCQVLASQNLRRLRARFAWFCAVPLARSCQFADPASRRSLATPRHVATPRTPARGSRGTDPPDSAPDVCPLWPRRRTQRHRTAHRVRREAASRTVQSGCEPWLAAYSVPVDPKLARAGGRGGQDQPVRPADL